MTVLTLAVSLLLVVANGGFVAMEFGLIGAKRAAVDAAAAKGRPAARAAQRMQSDVLTTLSGAQLGITLCSLALGRLAEPVVSMHIERLAGGLAELPESVLHSIGFGVALGLVAVVHMILGEMVPKNLALIGPERTLFVLARPMAAYLVVARPVVRALLTVSNALLRVLRVEPATELADTATPDELALMVRDSHDEGHLDDAERELIDRALHFGRTPVADVMAHVDDVAAVRISDTIGDVEQQFVRMGRSRLVVFGDGPDDVRGMLHSSDLAAVSQRPDATLDLAMSRSTQPRLVRQMLRFGASTTLDEALRRMQSARTHLAVVQDEAHRTLGVVALDDLLQGLLGNPTT